MDQILILNGSPRAPWSNSRQYAQIFARYCTRPTRYLPVRRDNHRELCCALGECADVVLAFPLYADAIPSTLLNFFKTLESHPPPAPAQDVGAHQLWLSGARAERRGCGHGALILPATGLSIRLSTAHWRRGGHPGHSNEMAGGAKAPAAGHQCLPTRDENLRVTMPLAKGLFLRAAAGYWTALGRCNGVTPAQMAAMDIEGESQ